MQHLYLLTKGGLKKCHGFQVENQGIFMFTGILLFFSHIG